MVSAIHVISQEEVICVWNITTNSEQLNQVMELAVNVTTNGHGTTDGLNIRFLQEYFASLLVSQGNGCYEIANGLHIGFREQLALGCARNPLVNLLDRNVNVIVHNCGAFDHSYLFRPTFYTQTRPLWVEQEVNEEEDDPRTPVWMIPLFHPFPS